MGEKCLRDGAREGGMLERGRKDDKGASEISQPCI